MKNMVFLSGAMTGLSIEEADSWRVDLQDKIEECGWLVFNPCQNGLSEFQANKFGDSFERMMMLEDLDMLRHSRLIIADFNHASLGTAAELMLAYELKIPIIGVCNSKIPHPWWEIQATVVVESYEDAFMYFIDHYANY